jgi:hypothetical protein
MIQSEKNQQNWRMTQSGANPLSNFPASREKYREIRIFEVDPGAGSAQSPLGENSLEIETGKS